MYDKIIKFLYLTAVKLGYLYTFFMLAHKLTSYSLVRKSHFLCIKYIVVDILL